MRKPEWVLDILEALQDSEVAIVKAREALETNLALTAAAPELLEACIKAVKHIGCVGTDENNDTCGVTFTCQRCRVAAEIVGAIAKAEGREE